LIFIIPIRHHPTSTLFPYTTLFRSKALRRILPHHRPSFERVERRKFIPIRLPADKKNSTHSTLLRARVRARAGVTGHSEISDNRSEEHTSELQSRSDLVCRLLLEKK